MDTWQIFITIITGIISGVGGSVLFYLYAQKESKNECKKAVLKELEFGLHKGISIVKGIRSKDIHISFKNIELLIYPNAIIRHPDLFDERDVFILSFIFNSFKTYNENAPKLRILPPLSNDGSDALTGYNIQLISDQFNTYQRLVNLLWEDIIYFFNKANYNIIPDSLKKHKSNFKNLTISDNPPKIQGLFEID
jgi:hypothetical protein